MRDRPLEAYRSDMEGCSRCCNCKWIPLSQVKSQRFSEVCPSSRHYEFHAYSGSGKLNVSLSTLDGRTEFDETAAEIVYSCTMCGGCDVGCKSYRNDIDLVETFSAARARAVELGHYEIEHLLMVENMQKENNVFGLPKEDRAGWAEGLGLLDANKEEVEILFHAGCRYSYDEAQLAGVRAAARLLLATGRRVGISGTAESCCGFRAHETGFVSEYANFADDMVARVASSGASCLAVACADCFGAFNVTYPMTGKPLGVPVRHVTEIAAELLEEGRLTLGPVGPRRVTYHDPCNLGRRGHDWQGTFEGRKIDRPDHMRRDGRGGRFEDPRRLLEAIPGIELVEMERIREYSWCCGAGGGCLEARPDFAAATADERIEEAASTGADAMVTSCPWCVHMFGEANPEMEILDINALLAESLEAGS